MIQNRRINEILTEKSQNLMNLDEESPEGENTFYSHIDGRFS